MNDKFCDFSDTELRQIVSKIVDLRFDSLDRDLVFNPGIAKFLKLAVHRLRKTNEFSNLYEIDSNGNLSAALLSNFERVMVSSYGERYRDFGEDFITGRWELYISPYLIK